MPKTTSDQFKMTLQELIMNPTGKRSAYVASRSMIKESLTHKYNALIMIHKKFDYKIYKQNDIYYFHYKIPSETYKQVLYDVIVEFYPDPDEPNCTEDKTTNRYLLKVFSNSPSFMFTYTYVVNENNLLADGTKKFCSKEALKSRPVVRNPVESYGYEKSVYFACLDIINKRLYEKKTIDKMLFKMKNDTFGKNIMTQENKLIEYNKNKNQARKIKKKAKMENNLIAMIANSGLSHNKIQNEIKKLIPSTNRSSSRPNRINRNENRIKRTSRKRPKR